ncbi:hypothetical protein [Aminobacter sp. J44]|nr:hypothetical protein [Aminobacter sp. J44]
MIAKLDQVSLTRRGRIVGKGAAQIAEARWRYDLKAALAQLVRN